MAKQLTGEESKSRVARHRVRAVTTTPVKPAQTSAELMDFFRSSPFIGEDFSIERDRSTGRRIDLT